MIKIVTKKKRIIVWTFRPTDGQIQKMKNIKYKKSDVIRTALNMFLKLEDK